MVRWHGTRGRTRPEEVCFGFHIYSTPERVSQPSCSQSHASNAQCKAPNVVCNCIDWKNRPCKHWPRLGSPHVPSNATIPPALLDGLPGSGALCSSPTVSTTLETRSSIPRPFGSFLTAQRRGCEAAESGRGPPHGGPGDGDG